MQEEITSKQIWLGILLVVIFIGGYFFVDFLLSKTENIKKVDQINQNIEDIKKSLSPYEYKDTINKVVIISGFNNNTKNNEPLSSFTEKIKRVGTISQGYLYIKASVDNKKLSTNDDIYLKISGRANNQYQELGGHLITWKSLETSKSDYYTEILFDLTDVKYKESYLKNDNEAISGDWLNLLNNSQSNLIIGFSSTMGNGIIEELSLYYKCNTGQDNCSIFVE